MKKTIEKIQNYSLDTKKTIIWSIVILLGISLAIWRTSVFKKRIKESAEEMKESVGVFLPKEELNYFREGMEMIGEMKDTIKEAGGTIKEAVELIKEIEDKEIEKEGQIIEGDNNINNTQ